MNPGDKPAFPIEGDPGMTKREKFAESAMQGFVTASNSNSRLGAACLKIANEEGMTGAELLAAMSVIQADALIAALAKPPEETQCP